MSITQVLHQLDDIEADRIGDGEQLDNVDAPLAGFGLCDPRLIEAETVSKFALIEIRRQSFLSQEFYKIAMQLGVDRLHSAMVNSPARYSKRGSDLE
jgi:hypothetical protein